MEDVNKEIRDKKPVSQILWNFYEKKYKQLLVFPMVILVLSLMTIAYFYYTTGEIVPRDVSLKGGITLTIPIEKEADNAKLRNSLFYQFPKNYISVRSLHNVGKFSGIIVEADIPTNQENIDLLLSAVEKELAVDLDNVNYGLETIGPSLGESFFREIFTALIFAFLFMGIVVLIYFRNFVPSIAIILAAFSDMVTALAAVHLMGIKVGTAGIAAFLMLIGYSVDTDILLTVRTLKRKEGHYMERIKSSIKTGMTMTAAAIVAVSVSLLITQSEVVRQIMTILLIGLIADITNTWIQNVGILRLYIEKREKKGKPI